MKIPRLCLVTDAAMCERQGRTLEDVVIAAVAGGVDTVQLREKSLSLSAIVHRATQLQTLLQPWHVPLMINDHVHVAREVGAAGVHLGQQDMDVHEARQLLPQALIGLSVETVDQLQRACALPVDYVALSPLFATRSKQDTAPPWGLAGLKLARTITTQPIVVIGGIDEHNVAQVMQAGADGVAVVSAICAAADPQGAAAKIVHAMA